MSQTSGSTPVDGASADSYAAPATAAPAPNQILTQPATVEACAADFAAGADVRNRLDKS